MVSRILEEMCQEVTEEVIQKADLQARKDVAKSLMRDGKLPLEDTAKYVRLSLDEVKKLAEQNN